MSSRRNFSSSASSSSSSSRPRVLNKVWNSMSRMSGRHVATTTTTERGAVIVGTQALALQRMESNQVKFKYPKEGFVTPIEHSLLYAMICEPKIYPEDVVLEQISNEDFETYLEIANDDGDDDNNNNNNGDTEQRASYAQLSALLAQSAENFPDVKPRQTTTTQSSSTSSSSYSSNSNSRRQKYDEDDDIYANNNNNNRRRQDDGQQDDIEQQQRIPQALCKAVLSCVTKYADRHELDRATEVKELLGPVESYMMGRNTNTLLPIYIAYSVGLFIPGGIGVGLTLVSLSAMIAASDKADQNAQTVQNMNSQRQRVANMETAGLLDEVEGY